VVLQFSQSGTANWGNSMASSSSVMAPFFANQSCDPFTAESRPCTLGNYVDYAVNVTSAADVIAAVKFAQKENIRFVIRNTGHESVLKFILE
jgi:FAD/FMN-containing dehydrogenase